MHVILLLGDAALEREVLEGSSLYLVHGGSQETEQGLHTMVPQYRVIG